MTARPRRVGPVPVCVFGAVPFTFCGKPIGGTGLRCFRQAGHGGPSRHYRSLSDEWLYSRRAPKPARFVRLDSAR